MFIQEDLMLKGQTIGVAVSGGMDSMALLHKLIDLKNKNQFDLLVVHVDHSIRPTSAQDAEFVANYCKEHGVAMHSFKVDAPSFCASNKMGLEEAARMLRYGVFDALIKKHIVDKMALAHHKNDQAETILLNLFRGTGAKGIQGMEQERADGYIRPLLQTSKQEIEQYVKQHNIPFVVDETNADNAYSRNFVRNQILPLITQKWPQAVSALTAFAASCAADDDYINSQVMMDGVLFDEKTAKIPTSYFLQHDAIVSRMIFETLKQIGITKDVERKHIELIKRLAKNAQNGSRISLPFDLRVIKEYDYITFLNKEVVSPALCLPFKLGKFKVEGFGAFKVSKANLAQKTEGALWLDGDKVPKGATWRFWQEGDMFTKFGGGTKKLKRYLVDKKIPSRQRQTLPVLAKDNQIFAILGVEISQQVRLDEQTKHPIEIVVL